LKLTNTNYLYWRMQMKPYLLGQGVFRLCWWFKLLPLSTYSCCRWCLSSGISTLSS
jgi:hypothetical protein